MDTGFLKINHNASLTEDCRLNITNRLYFSETENPYQTNNTSQFLDNTNMFCGYVIGLYGHLMGRLT